MNSKYLNTSAILACTCILAQGVHSETANDTYAFSYNFLLTNTSINSEEFAPKDDLFREPGASLLKEKGQLNGIDFSIEERASWISGKLSYNYKSGTVDYDGTTQTNNPFTTETDYTTKDIKLEFGVHGEFFNFDQSFYLGYGKYEISRLVKPKDNTAGLDEEYNWKYPFISIDLSKNFLQKWTVGFSQELRQASSPVVTVYSVAPVDNSKTFFGDVKTGDMSGSTSTLYVSYQLNDRIRFMANIKNIITELEEGTRQFFPIEGSTTIRRGITQPALDFENTQASLGVKYFF